MQKDFHYYATWCAAALAGFTPEESTQIAKADQFTDLCTATLLKKIHAPLSAATTQSQAELINARTDVIGLQNVTRIWSSFHFLPGNLYAEVPHGSRTYRNKYRLICRPNSDLAVKTVKLARDHDLESIGLAMHVLADTWAHSYFAGTPSQVINDTNFEFYEQLPDGTERPLRFRHSMGADDPEKGAYTNSINYTVENSIMILGHGRAGHLPDYSFIRYRYMPAWGGYSFITKNNPEDYMHAFRQMVTAMKYLRGGLPDFTTGVYDMDAVDPWAEEIDRILRKRQLDACDDWAALGQKITGCEVPAFDDTDDLQQEYLNAAQDARDDTFLGRYTLAALRQKSMVTGEIFRSGNMLAGFSIDYVTSGFRGIRDYRKLIEDYKEAEKKV